MELTLVRHGQTIENERRIVQGQSHGHLSARGIEQARTVAIELREETFDAIYTSDLRRCQDTAAQICIYHQQVPLYLEPALRELSFGDFQGQPSASVNWDRLEGTLLTRKVPGGESWTDLTYRVVPFLNKVFRQHAQERVLFVTHGGPMRVVLAYLGNILLEDLITQPIPNVTIWRFTMQHEIENDKVVDQLFSTA